MSCIIYISEAYSSNYKPRRKQKKTIYIKLMATKQKHHVTSIAKENLVGKNSQFR